MKKLASYEVCFCMYDYIVDAFAFGYKLWSIKKCFNRNAAYFVALVITTACYRWSKYSRCIMVCVHLL